MFTFEWVKKVRPDPEMFARKMPKVNKTRYVLFTFRQEIAMNLPGLRLGLTLYRLRRGDYGESEQN